MLSLLIISVISMLIWQSYLKRIFFSRDPKYSQDTKNFRSLVEGEVVYRLDTPDMIKKGRNRFLQIPIEDLNDDYYQIGVFMTQYDNHHIITPGCTKISEIKMYGYNSESPMLTFLDKILAVFGVKFFNWLERSVDFISYNQQYLFVFENGVKSVLTMDKVVNKFDIYLNEDEYNNGNRNILGFVRRGSQMDFFIPKKYKLKVSIGDKITFDTILIGD